MFKESDNIVKTKKYDVYAVNTLTQGHIVFVPKKDTWQNLRDCFEAAYKWGYDWVDKDYCKSFHVLQNVGNIAQRLGGTLSFHAQLSGVIEHSRNGMEDARFPTAVRANNRASGGVRYRKRAAGDDLFATAENGEVFSDDSAHRRTSFARRSPRSSFRAITAKNKTTGTNAMVAEPAVPQ